MTRRRPLLSLSLLLLLLPLSLVFFGEFGIHRLYSMLWAWPTLSPHEPLDVSRDTSFSSHTIEDVAEGVEATRILVVADPHIQCTFDKFEPWLYRWDSDRYLRQALGLLLSQLQPEVVVVVGDVFAEGYKASDTQWEEYLQCMHEILPVPSGVELVVLPGDNDIGGEGEERMITHINKRFVSEFGPLNDMISLHGLTLVKLNTVTYIHGRPTSTGELMAREETESFLEVVAQGAARKLLKRPILLFSHVPISHLHQSVKTSCLSSTTPDYIFSGHIHYAAHTRHTYTTDNSGRQALEWTVPTCSYRMGEAHMGVGAIFVDRHGRLGYSVLWLPPRYPILLSYLLLSLSLISLSLSLFFCGRPSSVRRHFWA